MKVLVLITDYPRPDGTHAYMFAHVRNLYYVKHGIDVKVLNFASKSDYVIDGISVITLSTYEDNLEQYDVLISHAANVRNHYRFIKRYENNFKRFLFFFHGQEILCHNEAYPEPYPYVKKNTTLDKTIRQVYDWFKLQLWSKYYRDLSNKSEFIFVSQWIFNEFIKNTGLDNSVLGGHCHIINNSIGEAFEHCRWDHRTKKEFDFITIRSSLDGSKYCVDLVMKIAEDNPQLRVLLIGRGEYFEHNPKPHNVEWIPRSMNHEEMFSYLNRSACGLLLTREDTQGVMTCELAASGMPVITSDIAVCHEFFEAMPNVALISNGDLSDVLSISKRLQNNAPYPQDRTYFAENTIKKEVELIQKTTSRR